MFTFAEKIGNGKINTNSGNIHLDIYLGPSIDVEEAPECAAPLGRCLKQPELRTKSRYNGVGSGRTAIDIRWRLGRDF